MGNYITEQDVTACFDTDSINRATDETVQDVLTDLITKREATFEGYAVKQCPDLVALRIAQPQQAQLWITDMVVYDLHKRRGAVPQEIKDQYLQTIQELKDFARSGIPELLATTSVQAGQPILSNMEETDLELLPEQSDNILSVWKGIM